MPETRPPVVIVTGAALGIGAATSEALVTRGWVVVAVDLDFPDPQAPGITQLVGDVTAEHTWEEATAAAQAAGELTGIVNNAGIQGAGSRLVDTALEEHKRILDVNVDGTFLGVRAGLRVLPRGGSIVNLASNAASRGVSRYGSYVAAKHAVLGLTRTAALEGARDGIRVNAVCPGPTETRIMDAVSRSFNVDDPDAAARRMRSANPSGRFAEPVEVARAIAWLLSDEATYVNGTALAVDGGLTSA